ncbi:hypothetical protein NDU88_000130 [Pleurodeles waltl]|uniref:Uncharacterized protein n=1 Tax=Pleurodeles waltl TaxID=8319 RepID=A0AAV7UQY9_PLEWA|nr:hypothetical protein NDU88_000130 [Pleurodeles waltl]
MLVSVSNAWETITINLINNNHLIIEEAFVRQIDNIFDSLICISVVASMCSLLAIAVDSDGGNILPASLTPSLVMLSAVPTCFRLQRRRENCYTQW